MIELTPSIFNALVDYWKPLEAATGAMPDQYSSVLLANEHLGLFKECLVKAKAAFTAGPEQLDILLGMEIMRDGSQVPMIAILPRCEVIDCVLQLEEMTERALRSNLSLLFVGD